MLCARRLTFMPRTGRYQKRRVVGVKNNVSCATGRRVACEEVGAQTVVVINHARTGEINM